MGQKNCSLPTAPSGGPCGDDSGQTMLDGGNNEADKYQTSSLLRSVVMKDKGLFVKLYHSLQENISFHYYELWPIEYMNGSNAYPLRYQE